MRYDICILSDERDFAQMLALELRRDGRRVCVCTDPTSLPEAEICLQDADRFPRGTTGLPGSPLRAG